LGAYQESELIAFICSTLTSSPTLTHESMQRHEPLGEYLAIHSVCVQDQHRNKGVAKGLLNEYLKRVNEQGRVKGIRLISKRHLVPMYEGVGFTNKGKSQVVHGKDPWFELAIDFDFQQTSSSAPISDSPFVQPDQENVPSTEMRSPGKRLLSTRSEDEVLKAVKGGDGLNLWDLYCPRGECRCLLVKKGTAKWVKHHEQDLDVRRSTPDFLRENQNLPFFSPTYHAFSASSFASSSHLSFSYYHHSSSRTLVTPFSPLFRKYRFHSFPPIVLLSILHDPSNRSARDKVPHLCRL